MINKPERILHVDDEPAILAVTAYALKKIGGYTVSSCSDSTLALETARAFKPDIILLDVMMPKMDGMQTLAALRNDPDTREIPVVYLTAKVQPREVQELVQTGVDGVLGKPFDPATLCDNVESIWRKCKSSVSHHSNGNAPGLSRTELNA
jgi:two-component system, OmpR family, response regulator